MAKVRPLSNATAARGTLAQRLAPKADRLRQLATKFGARSRRVFLVWVADSGSEVGTGYETTYARRELLPTPRVTDMTALSRRPLSVGIVPDGSIRVDQISAAWYTEDDLRGRRIPAEYPVGCNRGQAFTPGEQQGSTDRQVLRDPYQFFYEIVEDGRGDDPPARSRYMLSATPWRNETSAQWGILLSPVSSATDRFGKPTLDADDVLDVDG